MSARILIVDDSLTVRMDLSEAFDEAGFETCLCASAGEARDVLMRQGTDLIVLDVVLPDLDGVEFLAELRGKAETRDLPVVLLSGEAETKDRIRGLTGGADEYVGKPYDAPYVVARASALLRKRSQATGAAASILVIDDSLTYREEVAQRLRDEGYRTALASSGAEGLRKAADLHPDAIIVDGVMPGMNGTAVVRRIRLDPGLSITPCLLLTGSEGAASEVAALDSGADGFVRKGEGLEVVVARLAAMLRGAEQSRGMAPVASLLGPKRILAVGGSQTYLDEVAEELRGDGYEVVKARSGEEAIDLLAVEQVDCILLDVHSPGLSGMQTCRRIRGSAVLRDVSIILLAAHDSREAMLEGINAGADDFVSKTASLDVVKARVRAQLRRKQFETENRRVREELMRKDAQTQAARQVAEAREELLAVVSAKNDELAYSLGELQRLNQELETFAYSVSHDLRQPLRGMDGFSRVLLERYGDVLDEQGQHYLRRVRAGAQRMSDLIDGILMLSRVSRLPLQRSRVALDDMARRILQRLGDAEADRAVETVIAPGLVAQADPHLVESILENLIGNAWKFTMKRSDARIEIGATTSADPRTFLVRDNGAGFDMAYADKLFGPFQRLHDRAEYEGTGVGLATVQRIVHRHGGRIWVESAPNEGATFFFTLQPEVSS